VTAVAILLAAFGGVWFMFAGGKAGPLDRLERAYLLVSPLPVAVMFGIPLLPELLHAGGDGVRFLEPAGLLLSGVLTLAGLVLLWRRWVRGEPRDARLAAGIFLAGIPALLWLTVVLMYSL
jgi:hypothetical protein